VNECASIRPGLSRYAEGEASPAEALEIGRHLARCTPCRILLCRERRLVELLARLPDPLAVGDELLEGLRRKLPAPLPARRRAVARRGLRPLVVLVGLGGIAEAVRLASALGGRAAEPGTLPLGFGLEHVEDIARGLGGATRFLLELAGAIGRASTLPFAGLARPSWAVAALAGVFAASGFLVLALAAWARRLLSLASGDDAQSPGP